MKNRERQERNYLISDPVEIYFECISSCDVTDNTCVSKCVEILRDNEI